MAVHIDDGFDTEISKQNEKKICEKCGIDIRLFTPDEKQYKELPSVLALLILRYRLYPLRK